MQNETEAQIRAYGLLGSYYSIVSGIPVKYIIISNDTLHDAHCKTALKCALKTVQTILGDLSMYTGELNPKWAFWSEVKSELEKIGEITTTTRVNQ